MNKTRKTLLVTAVWLYVLPGIAHDRYILPSHTVLSGKTADVSLIASISNDMFHHDRPLGDNGKGTVPPSLKGFFSSLEPFVIHPDGSQTHENDWQAFTRFSARDVNLDRPGTYRVVLAQNKALMLTFRKKDGQPGRAFGSKAIVPEGATDVKRYTTSSRVETFLTLDKPSEASWKPTGKGLELSGDSHPNDLFVDEPASFQLFFGGQPLVGVNEVVLVREDTRHRNKRKEFQVKTDDQGRFQVTLDTPGFYLLKAEVARKGEPGSGFEEHYSSVFVTLEVFPQ